MCSFDVHDYYLETGRCDGLSSLGRATTPASEVVLEIVNCALYSALYCTTVHFSAVQCSAVELISVRLPSLPLPV